MVRATLDVYGGVRHSQIVSGTLLNSLLCRLDLRTTSPLCSGHDPDPDRKLLYTVDGFLY